ncbi:MULTISPECIES: hypothetical protein [unclassified Streptomyces]|uniref:hypothetical protein n=1 Tax=Streptomyces sp. NBRC 14336 TaxID=3030992 RepID=UPI002556E448|nr:hypothetical protein [Streptomyces sp. NBRC 14336]WBO76553.1 hypothetical protein SBE_006502 [Streptomyces sp. SBE_14.2]
MSRCVATQGRTGRASSHDQFAEPVGDRTALLVVRCPVKRLLQGAPADQVVNPAAVDNPELIDHYARLGAERRARRLG